MFVLRLMGVCLAAALLSSVAAGPVAAQVSTFDLSGTVTDDQGGVLPGVTVTARNEETGTLRSAFTDSAGLYYFADAAAAGQLGTLGRALGLRHAARDRRCASRPTPSRSST